MASQNARAVRRLTSERRLALTGTPIENRLDELWSIYDFCLPGYLGSAEKFRDRFELPIVRRLLHAANRVNGRDNEAGEGEEKKG